MATSRSVHAREHGHQRPLTPGLLRRQSRAFLGTGAVSEKTGSLGLAPAFLDTETGAVHLARFANGRPAPCHVLDGLPAELIVTRWPSGGVAAVSESVVAGFLYHGRFLTRQQAAETLQAHFT